MFGVSVLGDCGMKGKSLLVLGFILVCLVTPSVFAGIDEDQAALTVAANSAKTLAAQYPASNPYKFYVVYVADQVLKSVALSEQVQQTGNLTLAERILSWSRDMGFIALPRFVNLMVNN